MWRSGCVGNDESGSDAVGCLAEALLWSLVIFDCYNCD